MDYHNVVVGAIRSRGIYSGQTLVHEVKDDNKFILTGVTGYDMNTNPMGEFAIKVTGTTSGVKQFVCSFDNSDISLFL